jgi:hypothetical protein
MNDVVNGGFWFKVLTPGSHFSTIAQVVKTLNPILDYLNSELF